MNRQKGSRPGFSMPKTNVRKHRNADVGQQQKKRKMVCQKPPCHELRQK
jgi:hypothetical protein